MMPSGWSRWIPRSCALTTTPLPPVQAPTDVAAERLLVGFGQALTAGVGAAGGLSGGGSELHESAVR